MAFDQLYTIIHPEDFRPKITYDDSLLMMGSCFSEHISQKLRQFKYKVLSNPFGIIYNPASLATSLERIAKGLQYQEEELVHHDGLYHSMDHHGSYSHQEPAGVLENINAALLASREHLSKSKFVFISLGTAKVYTYQASGKIAANCHKIPQTKFSTRTLSIEEVMHQLEKMHSYVKALSPDAHLIWTVSPVRHIREGLVENQRSKSTLILAIDELIRQKKETSYFPAYEIMMDQLRDYRFYDKDLVHPSETAIDVIWESFSKTYIDPKDSLHHPAIEKVYKAMHHRFLHQDEQAIQAFARTQLRNIQSLGDYFPEMDWKEEKQYFFHLIEPD